MTRKTINTRTIFTTVLTIVMIDLIAQSDLSGRSREELSELAFFVGEWEGSATTQGPQGSSASLVQESISWDLDSTVLVISGTGVHQESGEIVHDARAMMYFDHDQEQLMMHSFLKNGRNTLSMVEVTGPETFKWWIDLPNGGKMTFYLSFAGGNWSEQGVYSSPEGQEYQTISMDLTRID